MFLGEIAKQEWKLPFAHVVGDPTHKLAHYLRSSSGFAVVITGFEGDEGYDTEKFKTHKAMKRYKHGVLQPGMLILRKSLNDVVFNWAIIPASANANGATIRPRIPLVWKATKKALKNGGTVSPAKVKKTGLLDVPGASSLMFWR